MKLKITIIILFVIVSYYNTNAQHINYLNTKFIECGINKEKDSVAIKMSINTSNFNVKDNKALIIEPILIKRNDTIAFPSIGIYGKYRHYYYMRNDVSIQKNGDDIKYLNKSLPDTILYSYNISNKDNIYNNALIAMREKEYGCCNQKLNENITILDTCKSNVEFSYIPKFIYLKPEVELTKTRSETASAYIDFPVSKIIIKEDYRNNKRELDKLISGISTIIDDKDITINSIGLKGYASPEGSYLNNKKLAEGRTNSVMNYICTSFRGKLNHDIISLSYEPENWIDLRNFVDKSDLTNKNEIISIIDKNIDIDKKEKLIKSYYPSDYEYLLTECYPTLRKTNYTINYTIKSFTDINEIKIVFDKDYKKLSLSEFYTLSKKYSAGSSDYNKIFKLAAKVYPNDATANINAANAAMSEGNLIEAEKFLEKAGNSVEATYSRGIHAALNKNFDKAKELFNKIKDKLLEAKEALKELPELIH